MTRCPPTSVLLAGGGTAGHVSPLLALADCLRRRHPDLRVTALGTQQGSRPGSCPARGYDLRDGAQGAVPAPPDADLLRLPGRLRGAVDAAGATPSTSTGAEVVVGFGGYVSTPAYLAARRRGVPIVVHEQNARARPGQPARRPAAPLRRDDLPGHRASRTPRLIGHAAAPRDRDARPGRPPGRGAATRFGLDRRRPTVLVTGGSLGAQRLNDAFAGAARA